MGTPEELAERSTSSAAGAARSSTTVFGFSDVRAAFTKLHSGNIFAKLVPGPPPLTRQLPGDDGGAHPHH